MLDNSDLMLPTNDLSSYIEVPENGVIGKVPVTPPAELTKTRLFGARPATEIDFPYYSLTDRERLLQTTAPSTQ
jgi:hypothetical protein